MLEFWLEKWIEIPFLCWDMSKLPIFEQFLSVENLETKLKWFFKPKLVPKIFYWIGPQVLNEKPDSKRWSAQDCIALQGPAPVASALCQALFDQYNSPPFCQNPTPGRPGPGMGSLVKFMSFEIGFGSDFIKFDWNFDWIMDQFAKIGLKSNVKLTKLD